MKFFFCCVIWAMNLHTEGTDPCRSNFLFYNVHETPKWHFIVIVTGSLFNKPQHIKWRVITASSCLSLSDNIMTVKKILLFAVIEKRGFGTVSGTRCF